MASNHESKPISGWKTHPEPTPVDQGDLSSTGKIKRSSSSSSTISSVSSDCLEAVFHQEIPNEPSKSTTGIVTDGVGVVKLDHHLPSNKSSPCYDDTLPESTLPSPLLGNSPDLSPRSASATQSPPVQMMERPDDPSYRIPSSVFSRTKSNTPMEWSVASNESLFSIHMGNMSFSRDHALLMGRSGELGIIKSGELEKPGGGEQLGKPGGQEQPTTSSQFMNYPSNNQTSPPVYQTADIGRKNANLSQGVGATEAAAAETMKEVLRENEEDRSEEKASSVAKVKDRDSACLSHHSDDSAASIKSFAFPILTGDVEKSGSVKITSQQPQRQQQQQQHPPPPQTHSQPQTPVASKPDTTTAPPLQTTSWFPCFSCCPFRT